jgi:molybdopterin molybdotransferase
MLSVAEALKIVLAQVKALPPERVPLAPGTLGLILAEDVASDLDMPPFDKAMMDGFALRTADLRDGQAELAIVEEISAGKTPTVEVEAGQASRIMTGAPIPVGVDAVVMIERCEILANSRVRISEPRVKAGLNILRRAQEMHDGEVVLHAGAQLRPQEFGLLSTVGRTEVKVIPAPHVAILSTGDEIVDPATKPGPGQIRNSNGPMLLAQVCRAGGIPLFLGVARDETSHLKAMIADGLRADVLILSGGVSAGKLDLVPGVLAELGVQALFHKVAMKPGKPVLFGIQPRGTPPNPSPSGEAAEKWVGGLGNRAVGAYSPDRIEEPRPLFQQPPQGRGEQTPRLVFGLPGNPVSTLVCFELFVRPALRGLMGLPPGPCWIQAKLMKDYPYRTDRPTYHPARLQQTDSGWSVEAVPWFGSPDLRGIVQANAFVLLPEGDHQHRAGQIVTVLRVENPD